MYLPLVKRAFIKVFLLVKIAGFTKVFLLVKRAQAAQIAGFSVSIGRSW